MYVGTDFSPENHGENEVFALDFVNDLPAGDSIVTSAWTCSVAQGVDPSPQTRITGSPAVLGTVSSQRVSGLLDGVRYKLLCTVTTAQGNTIILYSHVTCQLVT